MESLSSTEGRPTIDAWIIICMHAVIGGVSQQARQGHYSASYDAHFLQALMDGVTQVPKYSGDDLLLLFHQQ